MGQLIDKTVLRKELSKLPSEMGFVRKSDVMQILGSQKCAYDIDTVVEQLKRCYGIVRSTSVDYAEGLKDAYERAIDIVKAGGTCQ
mgnify:CR=1 FL=1